jgi:hypothetical protein
VTVEDVVAEDQARGLPGDEVAAEDEGLGEPVGARLLAVVEAHAEAAAVSEQVAVGWQVARRRDDEHLADAGQHEQAQRVVDHRLVVHRQQLLADHPRHRVESGAGAPGENDPLHGRLSSSSPCRAAAGGARSP